jgi:peptide deformylase
MSPTKKDQSGKVHPIVSEGHPALREVSQEIPLPDIASPKIQSLIADMKKSLATQEDGIGLAAPQIGVPLRIFIVSKKIFSAHHPSTVPMDSMEADITTKANGKSPTDNAKDSQSKIGAKIDDLVFINPVLTKMSKEKKWMEGEGCLSVRWVYGKVQRSTKVTIRAYDEFGRAFERGAGGLLAHIFQHEVDHLNGILFIDKAKDLEEVDPKDVKKEKAKAAKSAATKK